MLPSPPRYSTDFCTVASCSSSADAAIVSRNPPLALSRRPRPRDTEPVLSGPWGILTGHGWGILKWPPGHDPNQQSQRPPHIVLGCMPRASDIDKPEDGWSRNTARDLHRRAEVRSACNPPNDRSE